MTQAIPAGFQAGYIAVEAGGCGDDIIYWVLDQQQMDEVDQAAKVGGSDYCQIMGDVIDRHNLSDSGARCDSIKEALEYLLANKMLLIEDFNYISY